MSAATAAFVAAQKAPPKNPKPKRARRTAAAPQAPRSPPARSPRARRLHRVTDFCHVTGLEPRHRLPHDAAGRASSTPTSAGSAGIPVTEVNRLLATD